MPSALKIASAIAAFSLAAASAGAQTPAAPANFALPHAYEGYSQPEITQCAAASPLRSSCTVPAMTAGRYVILARASATATGAGAVSFSGCTVEVSDLDQAMWPMTRDPQNANRWQRV